MDGTKKQVSIKKRIANRSNARKSTGPRTPAGKARAAQNSVTCGFFGGDIVLKPFDPAGTAEEFTALRESLFDDLAPEGQLERVIVERIAAILWQQRRAYRLEGQALLTPDITLNPIADALHYALKAAAPEAPPQLFPSDSDFDKLIRYESLIDRQLHRAFLQLARLRRNDLAVPESRSESRVADSTPSATEPPECPASPSAPSSDSPPLAAINSSNPSHPSPPDTASPSPTMPSSARVPANRNPVAARIPTNGPEPGPDP